MLKKPAKIAVLATVTDFGGAEKVVLSLIRNNNFDLCELIPVIYTRGGLNGSLFFKYLDEMVKKYFIIYVNDYKFKYLNPFKNITETFMLLKRYKFDLIYSHGYRANFLGILIAKSIGVPVIATCHGYISNDTNLKLYNMLDRVVLRFANRIIAVSDGIKNDLIRSGIKESRIRMIPNAVELKNNDEIYSQNRRKKRQILNIEEKDFVVCFVGRLSEEKGIKYLIEASSLLNECNVSIKVLIIGAGPQKKELLDLVKERDIKHKVFFTGFQNDIDNWFPAIDVFVLPSLTEGTPMSLLEAMAWGIPVVASAVGGIPQVIDSGKNGILVPPGRPEEIKNNIYLLYRNEGLRNDISQAAKETIKLKYNVKDWIKKIEEEYLKILK